MFLQAIRASGQRVGAALRRVLWQGDHLAADDQPAIATGFRRLNRELPGGGWPVGALTELLIPRAGIGEMRLLAPALRHLAAEDRWMVLVAPSSHDDSRPEPYGPALEQLGLKLDRLLVIDTQHAADRLWAVEQALRCPGFGALLAWLPDAWPDQLRKLQLAAQGSEGLCFVMRPPTAQIESSPSPLRLACRAVRSSAVDAPTGINPHRIEVDIFKRRGPPLDFPLHLELPPLLAPAVSHAKPQSLDGLSPEIELSESSQSIPRRPAHVVDRPRLYAVAA
ncbi:translesion DNA synthesis-associated protein ImuA [Derxia gummosa]|uniref:Translesion DNA synthesis-associated protein ImuA n=1 Tax=Derxia gummosa DSM 723 TaxID=1121388 RepID=A0A8B6X9A0_9BURK|nr:translesion DNA synthesis-associated protein ImuA [Derxia gummosa]